MATTNLSYSSIGSIQFSSGNGIPDHIPAQGSLYINLDTGTWFFHNGLGNWTPLKIGAYGSISTNNNTISIGIAAVNTWYTVCNRYTWREDACKGSYLNNGKLQIKEPGLYNVKFNAVLKFSLSVNSIYNAALIKNEDTSAILAIGRGRLNSSEKRSLFLAGENIVRFVKDDRLEIVIQNITTTTDCILKNATIIIYKITD